MEILKELRKRKILKAVTNDNKLKQLQKGAGVYIGFDPTAESLHLGNYIQIALLLRMKNAGYNAIAIIGTATASIGDPAGRKKERQILSKSEIAHNSSKIKKQLEKFGLKVIDNKQFYNDLELIPFLRKIGKIINLNYMINKEVVSSRLETGISFTEFTYQLLQGYDFYKLYKNYNIKVQMGGSDQWGNITTGIELIRKIEGNKNFALGIITNLMTTSQGEKFGKTQGNAIWIDKSLTSPYSLYQYLLNTSDRDLETLFNWLTFLSSSKIKTILEIHKNDPSQKHGQKELAKSIVQDIHSDKDYKEALKVTKILFTSDLAKDLSQDQIQLLKKSIPIANQEGDDLQDFFTKNKIFESRREVREAINNQTLLINGQKIQIASFNYNPKTFLSKPKIIKKGKKHFFLAIK